MLVIEVDLGAAWAEVRGARPLELALSLGLSLLVCGLVVWRWLILLRLDGVAARFGPLLLTYVESLFFSLFLPSALGGDVFLGARMREEVGGIRRVSVNLATVRVIGLWAVCALAAACLVFGGPATVRLRAAVMVTCAAVLIGSALLISRRVQAVVTRVLHRLRLPRLAELHELMVRQFHDYLRPGSITEMMAISLLQQLLAVVSVYYIGRAAGLTLDLSFYLMVMPVVWLLGMVPAVGGIGPREAVLAYAIVDAGGSQEQAVATAALVVGIMVARGLIGGAVWVLRAAWGRTPASRRL